MNLDKLLVLVLPLIVVTCAVTFLIIWGALGNTNEKQDPNKN